MTVDTIECRRCSRGPRLAKAPFRTDLGERILTSICANCWKEWLEHQTVLINHYGLDPREQKSKDFLYEQIEQVLLGGGQGKDVDTSQQGSIEW